MINISLNLGMYVLSGFWFSCLIAANLLSGLKTCADIKNYMQYNDAMDTTVCTPHISFLALPTHYQ